MHHCIIASLHHCTIAPLHHCTIAPLHHCISTTKTLIFCAEILTFPAIINLKILFELMRTFRSFRIRKWGKSIYFFSIFGGGQILHS